MKKIYITALHLMHGGVEMAITALSNALVRRGYDVNILCTYNLGTPAYPLDPRVEVTYLTGVHPNREEFKEAVRQKNIVGIFREGLYALRVLRLKKQVLKEQFQSIREGIIISTRNEDSVLLSRYGNEGVLKIAQLHHDHGFDKKMVRDFKQNYSNIDVFTVLTAQLQEEISDMMRNNRRTKCVVLPNMLPETQSGAEVVSIENQVVAVGRLHPVKGFSRLIRLWKPVYEQTGTVLKIIGGGDLYEQLQREISAQGLGNAVVLTGATEHDQVLEEMGKSIFFAMTSLSEGLPYVLIEAMSCGLPAIAYDVRVGPRAVIDHEENGLLVSDDDEKAFVENALLLINDPQLRQKMSDAAKQKATDFTEETIVAKWLALF